MRKTGAFSIGFVAVVLFLIFFMLYRHRQAKRLAEVKAAQERMEGELQIARNIQMSMVPQTFPEIDGLDMFASMTPAREVGGDLYSYLLLGDKLYFSCFPQWGVPNRGLGILTDSIQ